MPNRLKVFPGTGHSIAWPTNSQPVVSADGMAGDGDWQFNRVANTGTGNTGRVALLKQSMAGQWTSLIAGYEEASSDVDFGASGQTIGSTWARGLRSLMGSTSEGLYFVSGYPGGNYSTIKSGGLIPGTANPSYIFANWKLGIERARALAAGAGLGSVDVPSTYLHLAENEANNASYSADILELLDDQTAAIQEGDAGAPDPSMLILQGPTDSGIAQNQEFLVCDQLSDRCDIVAPSYCFERQSESHPVHWKASSYSIAGYYAARAWYRRNVESHRWRPVWPVRAFYIGSAIYVEHSSTYPLQIKTDDAIVGNPTDKGFVVEDAASRTISAVTMESARMVKIQLSGVPVAPIRIRYATVAHTTAADIGVGAICDTDPYTIAGHNLLNWCPRYTLPVSLGSALGSHRAFLGVRG